MTLTLVPFSDEHLPQAAELLAARHRRDRTAAPGLPARYEDSAAACVALQEPLREPGVAGVIARQHGAVVGYLLGAPALLAPTGAFAGFVRPRAVEIPFAGLAADGAYAAMLYARMYAFLAQRWVEDGLVAQYATVPANPEHVGVWLDLGFARFIDMGVRDTDVSPLEDAERGLGVEIRRAEPGDEEAVQGLVADLFRSFADPPIFVPFLPETAREREQFLRDRLADLSCPCWMAFRRGRPVSLQLLEEPSSPHWHQSPMQSPEKGLYLFLACTTPEARGTGIGAVLFARAMTWAREAGYERCAVHYLTASRAAPFWRGLGFTPVSHWLCRVVDERAIWGNGRA